MLNDDFYKKLNPYWIQVCTGGGKLQLNKSILRLGFESAQKGQYTDAQIDDYTMLSRSAYPWKPPLRMTVRARFSLPAVNKNNLNANKNILRGTAGFGFWNNPFSLKGDVHALPEAIWFFYSAPPSNMVLVPDVPGWGWKAQSLHNMRLGVLSHVLPLSITSVYARLTGNLRPASYWLQRFAGANEALMNNDLTRWHIYKLEWHPHESIFWVDNTLILRARQAPTRPLGFVAWVDNQYAITTPQGKFRFGTIDSGAQWLDIDYIKIKSLKK